MSAMPSNRNEGPAHLTTREDSQEGENLPATQVLEATRYYNEVADIVGRMRYDEALKILAVAAITRKLWEDKAVDIGRASQELLDALRKIKI